MRITIHQPEFAPWLGFFDKARLVDCLVLLDDVQFRKNYFHNRNRVRTAQGWSWMTVPIARSGLETQINEVAIASDQNFSWREKIERTVEQAYSKAPAYKMLMPEFRNCFSGADRRLISLNVPILLWMLKCYRLDPDIIYSSALKIDTTGSQRILDICRKVGASTYVSGISGKDYLDLDSFTANGIAVEFQNFHHPIYRQLHEGFEPQISAVEPLFIFGNEARSLLAADWPERSAQIFT